MNTLGVSDDYLIPHFGLHRTWLLEPLHHISTTKIAGLSQRGKSMPDELFLTPWLQDQIRDGNAILFLGAGAAYGAKGPNGEKALSTNELRDALSERFLGGELKERTLAEVAEYAKNEASLHDVQMMVNSLFEPLEPAQFHHIVTSFRWHAIVTTNYDYIVERVYAANTDSLQVPIKIVKDGDAASANLGDARKVPYLKLHGCLSAIGDEALPLILSTEEYARHRRNRERVFRMFADWATAHPIIFCGYNIGDPNIQQILFDLGDLSVNRPTYAVINPSLNQFDIRYWQSKRFVPKRATLEEFLMHIDSHIPSNARLLSVLRTPNASSIHAHIAHGKPSPELLLYVENELEHVREGMPTSAVRPRDFYRGSGHSWDPIINRLDIERRFMDELLFDAVLEPPANRRLQTYLVKGHAGSGKSIALRRTAWNAAVDHEAFVFWLNQGAELRFDLVHQLYNLTNERIYIFVEDAIQLLKELQSFSRAALQNAVPVTLIIAARTNEWNVAEDEYEEHLTASFELRHLDNREIRELLDRLEKNDCLGHLESLDIEERSEYFRETADRQLLVALHEATTGKSFEEIVVDEFTNVVPREAQALYLDVCTFHRLRVPLRAGLVSRISGISLDYFRERLFNPLEHVVQVVYDRLSRDYAYQSRHPVIADLVFQQALRDPEQRADQIVRLIRCMNSDFQSDQVAFGNLISGRELTRLFDDRVLVDRIFQAASEAAASAAHVEHQRAVFEINHPSGNVHRALDSLQKAEAEAGHRRRAIRHTRAQALRKVALESRSELERDRVRSEAVTILRRLIRSGGSSRPYHTLGQILLDELKERIQALQGVDPSIEELRQRQVGDLIDSIERLLREGLQHYPGQSYLSDLEARLASILDDEPRAVRALERALAKDPGNGFISSRLAGLYRSRGDANAAKLVLTRCLEKNPTDREAHLRLARLLSEEDESGQRETIRHHLRRSFAPGDANYDAQFWYARHEFLYGDVTLANEVFDALRRASVPPGMKQRARGKVRESGGKPKVFHGSIRAKLDGYCFARCAELAGDVFLHPSSFPEGQWETVTSISEIKFQLAFSLRGPVGQEAQKLK